MIYAIVAAIALLLAFAVVRILASADPAQLARVVRLASPVLAAAAGTALLALGKPAVGGVLYVLALALVALAGKQSKRLVRARTGRTGRATVRSAGLDMQLDHASGRLDGQVLAGRHEQRMLSSMTLGELLEVYQDVGGDSESRQLLEAYLDGRFAVWREHAEPHGDVRQGVSPGPGSMTEQEAYKVLGLEAGASAAEIRKAHRRLIQSLDPHVGETSALALRINAAKDILLAKHD